MGSEKRQFGHLMALRYQNRNIFVHLQNSVASGIFLLELSLTGHDG